MNRVCIYLRKSRADEEAEKYNEGETLSKHRKILLKVANDMDLNILKIRQEVVSGESLIHRPEMLELLKEVEEQIYEAVLCMDIDRLGRGNMQEQGLILETFKKSNTKIITPRKIYNLQDEFDEEYSEFEAFMARKELKIINRRLQRGRLRSIEDGNYIATLPPYGYEIHYEGKFRTLKPHPEQSYVVKLIFELYTKEHLGCKKIANKLNQLGYRSYTGRDWSNASVNNIIKNEVYTGKVQWKKNRITKSSKPNQNKEVKMRPKSQWITVDGKHEAIISDDIYGLAQKILRSRSHVPHNTKITNPLAGIVRCKFCGSSMVYRPYGKRDPHIVCYNNCGNKSSKFIYIEERLLKALKEWLIHYKAEWKEIKYPKTSHIDELVLIHKKALKNLKTELAKLEKQKNNLHDLLERGIYNIDTFIERSENITQRIEEIKINIDKTEKDLDISGDHIDNLNEIAPLVENVLDLYTRSDDAAKKNILLKTVLNHAEYSKMKNQRNDQFTLIIYPKLPRLLKSDKL
ncbi:recombinase family protein [Wukongibacter baidiensis]|uniref:recombinase family protein n=1 Tax=Wukongibacter baidiensis TaxID=1723361 RepID=UPI003D7FE408